MLQKHLTALADYAVNRRLIQKEDETYAVNRVLHLIGGDVYNREAFESFESIDDILKGLLDFAAQNGKLKADTVTYRDILSADIMDCFTARPSEVISDFRTLYHANAKQATDYFYSLSESNNYIMTERIKKNIIWKTETKYGKLDITVNLSKPEKDPKDIAAAKNVKQSGYPKCLLCKENEGFEGHENHPPRANHRVIPLTLSGDSWYFQYSPYVYYNEHCIVFNSLHTPMVINKGSFERLLDFVTQFPHYFIGSNADLPIVGGSILTHDHFQGGSAELPMALATYKDTFSLNGFGDIAGEILNWPLSAMRLKSQNKDSLVTAADKILRIWREYSDPENEILAKTTEPHNTVTPIARVRDGLYELDLILRNNRTTEEHPLGIFHPHSEYHYIKKENIGLIEAMGLAVLPPRLKNEFDLTDAKVRDEIGEIFAKILENCGVFKDNEQGNRGFRKFIEMVNNTAYQE